MELLRFHPSTPACCSCLMRDILCPVLSTGPPEAAGLHLPPHSLQRGLQAGRISVLPLPPHQQKTDIFLRTLKRCEGFSLLICSRLDWGFCFFLNWGSIKPLNWNHFSSCRQSPTKVKHSSDELTWNMCLFLTLLGRNVSQLHREPTSFVSSWRNSGTVMKSFRFFCFYTNKFLRFYNWTSSYYECTIQICLSNKFVENGYNENTFELAPA